MRRGHNSSLITFQHETSATMDMDINGRGCYGATGTMGHTRRIRT